MINAGTIGAYLTLDTNKFSAGLKSANAQLKAFSDDSLSVTKKIQSVGGALNTIGGTMTRNLTVPLLGAGMATVKFTTDYESAFTGVRKTVDATEEEYKKLSDNILEMSKRMPAAATEIAGVMEAAGQLGIEKNNLQSFTETMVMLGDSTNLSADGAASALAKFANVTRMSASDYGKLGSTIVNLGNNFATTESDIVNMATYLASTGSLVGLSQAQIMAVATALSSCGIEAEVGGSAVSKLLKQIEVAVKTFETSSKAIDSTGYSLRELELLADQDASSFKGIAASLGLTSTELKNYMSHANDLQSFSSVAGISAKEFIKAWGEDAVGALGMFIDGLNDTERNGKAAVEILDDMGITEVRLSNAVLSLASSNGILNKAVDHANEAWSENTALSNEAEQRYATFTSQCSILWNEIKALGIELGDELMPIAKDLVSTVSQVVSWFSALDSRTKRTIVNMGLVAASIGPVSTVFGKLTTGVGTLIETISTAITVFRSAGGGIAGIGAALTSVITPAGLVVASFTAVVGVGYAIYKAYEKSSNKVTEFSKIMEKSAEISNKVEETTQALKNLEQVRIASYVSQASELETIEHLKTMLSSLVDENGKLIGSKEELQIVIQRLKSQGFDVEYNATKQQIEGYDKLIDKISDYIQQKKAEAMLESLDDEYQNALTKKAQYYDEYTKALSECYEIRELLNDQEYISGLSVKEYEELGNRFNELNGKASEAFQNYKSACETIDAYDKSMASIAKGDFETATSLLSRYYNDLASVIKRQSDYAKEEQQKAFTELSAQLIEQIQAYGGAMQLGNENILNDAKTYLEEAASELEKAGVKIPDGLIYGLEKGYISVDKAMETISYIVQHGTDNVDLTDSGESAIYSYTEGMSKMSEKVAAIQMNINSIVAQAAIDRRNITQEETEQLNRFCEELTNIFTSNSDAWLAMVAEQEACGGEITETTRKMVDIICSAMEVLPEETKESMHNTWLGIKQELEAAYPELYAAAEEDADSIINAIDTALGIASPSRVMREKGKFTIQGFIQGMESQSGSALSSINSIMNSFKTAAGSISFVSIGENVISGIRSGLNAKKSSLFSTAKSIASSISSTIKSALKINSPSRVMAEIGEFTTAGLELGLINGRNSLYNTASIIASDTAEALSGITNTRINYQQYPTSDCGDKLDRLIEAVEHLADSQTGIEIDGRAFGRMVRKYV